MYIMSKHIASNPHSILNALRLTSSVPKAVITAGPPLGSAASKYPILFIKNNLEPGALL